jgi:hypothetical protein
MSPPRIDAHSRDRDITAIVADIWPALEVAKPLGVEAARRVALALRTLLRRGDFPPEAVLDVTTMAAALSGEEIFLFSINGKPLVAPETSGALIMSAAESLGKIPGGRINVVSTFHIGVALRALLRGGMGPAEAVKAISALAMTMAGVDCDDRRVKL